MNNNGDDTMTTNYRVSVYACVDVEASTKEHAEEVAAELVRDRAIKISDFEFDASEIDG
jgi:hypothetical protein